MTIPTAAEIQRMQSVSRALGDLSRIFGRPPAEVPAAILSQRLEAEALETGDLSPLEPLLSRKRMKLLRRDGRKELARIRRRLADAETVIAAGLP